MGREGDGARWGGEGRERRGGEKGRREGVSSPNVRDALTPLVLHHVTNVGGTPVVPLFGGTLSKLSFTAITSQ